MNTLLYRFTELSFSFKGGKAIPPISTGTWSLLTRLSITAPDVKHPLLEINEDCQLPILASLELSHLGLLKWDADGTMPPITSFVRI